MDLADRIRDFSERAALQQNQQPQCWYAVWARARYNCSDREEARELAEEAWQEAIRRSLEKLPEIEKFEHYCRWLRRVAINFLTDQWRKRTRESLVEDDSFLSSRAEPSPKPDWSGRIEAALEQFSEEDRYILRRVIIDGITQQEVAVELQPERSRNAANIWLSRRLDKLLHQLRTQLADIRAGNRT